MASGGALDAELLCVPQNALLVDARVLAHHTPPPGWHSARVPLQSFENRRARPASHPTPLW